MFSRIKRNVFFPFYFEACYRKWLEHQTQRKKIGECDMQLLFKRRVDNIAQQIELATGDLYNQPDLGAGYVESLTYLEKQLEKQLITLREQIAIEKRFKERWNWL